MIGATVFTAKAQTAEGTWLVGGSASFTSAKAGGASESTSSFAIAPDAGYFIADNLAVGASISFQSATGGYSSFLGAPIVRYYFFPIGDNAKLFAQGQFGFGSIKPSSESESQSYTVWALQAGPAFFLNEHVALETTIGYSQSKAKDIPAAKAFGVNVGFQIHLGGGKAKK